MVPDLSVILYGFMVTLLGTSSILVVALFVNVTWHEIKNSIRDYGNLRNDLPLRNHASLKKIETSQESFNDKTHRNMKETFTIGATSDMQGHSTRGLEVASMPSSADADKKNDAGSIYCDVHGGDGPRSSQSNKK